MPKRVASLAFAAAVGLSVRPTGAVQVLDPPTLQQEDALKDLGSSGLELHEDGRRRLPS
jgi:hypothetical protein